MVIVLILGALLWLLGFTTQEEFQDNLIEKFEYQRIVVWDVLNNVQNFEINKKDVERVEIASNDRGYVSWTEYLDNGGFRKYRMVERRVLRYLSIELYDSSNGVTGTWVYELRDIESGTEIRITEDSVTDNTWTRGLQVISGRDVNLINAMKTIRVGLFQTLLTTP
jgi:hypothetical protein